MARTRGGSVGGSVHGPRTRGGVHGCRERRRGREHVVERIDPSSALNSESSTPPVEPQVAAITQSTATVSRKNSRVRGITYGKGVRKTVKSAKDKLQVEFDYEVRRAICDNAEAFSNEIGYILRNNCSFQYKEWRRVPLEVKATLREKLLRLFDIDIADKDVQDAIDSQMQKAWRGYKYRLHNDFKNLGGENDPAKAKSTIPDGVTKENWEYLCDYWADDSYKERAKKNVQARAKRKWESRNGSKSTVRHHLARGIELDAPTGQIETWRIRHWHSEKGWSTPELEAKYDEMMQLREENPPEIMSDKMILEKVLGRQSNRLFGWGRSPSRSRGTCSGGSRRPTYNQILNELKEANASHEALKQNFLKLQRQLIDGNIIPSSSLAHAPSDNCSGAGVEASHLGASPSSDHGYSYDSDEMS